MMLVSDFVLNNIISLGYSCSFLALHINCVASSHIFNLNSKEFLLFSL